MKALAYSLLLTLALCFSVRAQQKETIAVPIPPIVKMLDSVPSHIVIGVAHKKPSGHYLLQVSKANVPVCVRFSEGRDKPLEISGICTQKGVYSISLSLSDISDPEAAPVLEDMKTIQLIIAPRVVNAATAPHWQKAPDRMSTAATTAGPLIIGPTTLPAGQVGQPYSAQLQAAELIPQSSLSVNCDSVEPNGYACTNAIDGNPSSFWYTDSDTQAPYPHYIDFDAGSTYVWQQLTYLPRQDIGDVCADGWITNYAIYASVDGVNWGSPITTGTLDYSAYQPTDGSNCDGSAVPPVSTIAIPFTTNPDGSVSGTASRYLRFQGNNGYAGPFTATSAGAAEINLYGSPFSAPTTTVVSGITLVPTSTSLVEGASVQFSPTVTCSSIAPGAVCPQNVAYTSTLGTITSAGFFTAPTTTGTSTITATATGTTFSAKSTVKVTAPPPLPTVSISQCTKPNGNTYFVCVINFSNATSLSVTFGGQTVINQSVGPAIGYSFTISESSVKGKSVTTIATATGSGGTKTATVTNQY